MAPLVGFPAMPAGAGLCDCFFGNDRCDRPEALGLISAGYTVPTLLNTASRNRRLSRAVGHDPCIARHQRRHGLPEPITDHKGSQSVMPISFLKFEAHLPHLARRFVPRHWPCQGSTCETVIATYDEELFSFFVVLASKFSLCDIENYDTLHRSCHVLVHSSSLSSVPSLLDWSPTLLVHRHARQRS